MPVYIEKYGDLFGCHHSGTTTTRKDRATQPMGHGRLRWANRFVKYLLRECSFFGRDLSFITNPKLDSYSITIFHVSLLDLQLINFIRSVYSLHVIYRKTPNTLSLLRAFFQQELIPTHTSTNIPTLTLTTCNSMDLAVWAFFNQILVLRVYQVVSKMVVGHLFWATYQVNYLLWEDGLLPESAWCSIPFNESSAQWVIWTISNIESKWKNWRSLNMALGSLLQYFRKLRGIHPVH